MSEPVKTEIVAPAASFWHTVKTVGWSFLGIRGRHEAHEDLARINPFHIIVAGIVGVLIFVVGLIVLVNWVVAK
ncbi:MAG: DUF2970 domain-containing protein [Polaromonas sp.]